MLVPAQIRQMIIDAASPSRLAPPRRAEPDDFRRFVEALASAAAAAIGSELDPDNRLEQCQNCGKVGADLLVETRVDGLHVCGDCFDDLTAHLTELGRVYGPRQRCPFCGEERTLDTDECGGDGEGICEGYTNAIDTAEADSDEWQWCCPLCGSSDNINSDGRDFFCFACDRGGNYALMDAAKVAPKSEVGQ